MPPYANASYVLLAKSSALSSIAKAQPIQFLKPICMGPFPRTFMEPNQWGPVKSQKPQSDLWRIVNHNRVLSTKEGKRNLENRGRADTEITTIGLRHSTAAKRRTKHERTTPPYHHHQPPTSTGETIPNSSLWGTGASLPWCSAMLGACCKSAREGDVIGSALYRNSWPQVGVAPWNSGKPHEGLVLLNLVRRSTTRAPHCCWGLSAAGLKQGESITRTKDKLCPISVSLQCPLLIELNILPIGRGEIFRDHKQGNEGWNWSWEAMNWQLAYFACGLSKGVPSLASTHLWVLTASFFASPSSLGSSSLVLICHVCPPSPKSGILFRFEIWELDFWDSEV